MQRHKVNLDHITKGLFIEIVANIADTFSIELDADQNNEAEHQIVEGCFYQYKLNLKDFSLQANQVVEVSNFNSSEGRISPNFYVGTLSIPVFEGGIEKGLFYLEVKSIKSSYRKDYRFMLKSITEYATDLILQTNSPVSKTVEVDHNKNSKTLYQQFCFVSSIINNDEFDIAIQQIIQSPVTNWTRKLENKDVRSLKKLHNGDIRNLINSQNRVRLPSNHSLFVNYNIKSIALKIPTTINQETVDTAENRFIKYVLETFLQFCEDIKIRSKQGSRLFQESQSCANQLQSHLNHNLFKEVSKPAILKLNSPILQKKSGYRRVLKTWLMFDLAAKLIWEGGEDVYSAGNKNIAKLYEYWLFFKLIDAIKETFNIDTEEYKKLIVSTKDSLGLQLKEGKEIAINGSYSSKERELSIQFSYNKSFKKSNDLSVEGSWTLQMDPDYTLSIWPKELGKDKAERREQIVHIHFDAKYKVKNKEDNSDFKREDVIKMHAYKDAIRRTGGAYILYPGTNDKPKTFNGFHEILPGLGAFAIRPSNEDSGIDDLVNFIKKIKDHFLNRVTQRENLSSKTYQIIKNKPSDSINEPMPEYLNNKKLIPDETFVLVGFHNGGKHYDWIRTKHTNKYRYNFRMGSSNGSLVLDHEAVNAEYLLLHTFNDKYSTDLWKIVSKGPKVFNRINLEKIGYPKTQNLKKLQQSYLVIEIEKVVLSEFGNKKWDFTKLKNYKKGNASAKPFTSTIAELSSHIYKD